VGRGAHARVGAAAAQIGHRSVDLGIARFRVGRQQRRRGHQHAALAIAALRHLLREPGALQRMRRARAAQRLDRAHRLVGRRGQRRHARTHRRAVDMHGAGAAGGDAAAEFGAGQAALIAQPPQQRHLRVGIGLHGLAVERELHRGAA
jgi:hypothetical protein